MAVNLGEVELRVREPARIVQVGSDDGGSFGSSATVAP